MPRTAMEISAQWRETAQGPALYVAVDGRSVAFLKRDVIVDPLQRTAHGAAISLWEGMAGVAPGGALARWLWRRRLKRLSRQIYQALEAAL